MFAPVEINKIAESNNNFSVDITIDSFSRRAWVNEYAYHNPEKLVEFILDAGRGQGLEKIIFPAQRGHFQDLKGLGFSAEGVIDGYFNGHDALMLTAYLSKDRAQSGNLPRYLEQVRNMIVSSRNKPGPPVDGFKSIIPDHADIPALNDIFRKVFASYPSPVDRPDYLAAVLGQTSLYRAVKRRGRIVSVAAAEISRENGSAEMTNCATLPAARGAGFMSALLADLEQDCLAENITCLYSLARASSYGMNLVYHRLGYRYRGTLINNCHISGKFEDMNIWVKLLR